MWIRLLRTGMPALLLLITSGCGTLGYYGQSIAGQMQLLRRQQAVDTLLADPATDTRLKTGLQEAGLMLRYAHEHLGLPDNGSYRHYVDTGRSHIVWNVFAAPEFSLEPKRWCYLLVGCMSYRGYFNRADALEYARELERAGWEVSVNGVSAYSTLGWLRDPLLNTMFEREGWETARLLFHELSHQLIYFPDDTDFNEAFADAVAMIGLRSWLQQHEPAKVETVTERLSQEDSLYALLLDIRGRYSDLYDSGLSAPEMRARKTHLQQALQQEYLALKQQWEGDARYDGWISGGINNAGLAALSTYRALVPDFTAGWQYHDRDLPRFYRWVSSLRSCDRQQRRFYVRQPHLPVTCRHGPGQANR